MHFQVIAGGIAKTGFPILLPAIGSKLESIFTDSMIFTKLAGFVMPGVYLKIPIRIPGKFGVTNA